MTSRRSNDPVGPASASVRIDPFLILLAGVLIGFLCLWYGFPFYGDDSTSHAISYSHFAAQLWQGDLYPRWIAKMNGGLGSAFFFYYGPVPYYLTSVLRPAFPHDNFGWQQLGIGAVISIIASGLVLYLWLKQSTGRGPSLIAAIVYMLLPYHLNIDLYFRGAYAELWSFVWMPLVLFSIDGLIKRRRFGFIGLSISYALLVMTHLPTTVIFSLVPLGYSLAQPETKERIRVFFFTVAAMGIGIGLSAIYLLPALALQRFSFLSEATVGHYFYGSWFLLRDVTWSSNASLFWFTLEVAALALLAFIVHWTSSVRRSKQATFWFVVVIMSVVMMTPLSEPIWKMTSALQKVQFPWRFNLVLSLGSAVLLALAFSSMRNRSVQGMLLNVSLIVLIAVWSYDAVHRGWNSYPIHYIDQTILNERNAWLSQSRDQNECRPRWVVSIKEKDLDELLRRLGKSDEGEAAALLNGPGSVTVSEEQRAGINLEVNTPSATVVEVAQFYFPGWRARLDKTTDLDVSPSIPGGLVSFNVPAGSHEVWLQRVATPPERLGELASALSLLLLILIQALQFFVGSWVKTERK